MLSPSTAGEEEEEDQDAEEEWDQGGVLFSVLYMSMTMPRWLAKHNRLFIARLSTWFTCCCCASGWWVTWGVLLFFYFWFSWWKRSGEVDGWMSVWFWTRYKFWLWKWNDKRMLNYVYYGIMIVSWYSVNHVDRKMKMFSVPIDETQSILSCSAKHLNESLRILKVFPFTLSIETPWNTRKIFWDEELQEFKSHFEDEGKHNSTEAVFLSLWHTKLHSNPTQRIILFFVIST